MDEESDAEEEVEERGGEWKVLGREKEEVEEQEEEEEYQLEEQKDEEKKV